MKKKKKISSFKWHSFSKKQLKVMTWWCNNSPYKDCDGIIADGSVRSGKTISMAPSFVNWAMETFEDCDFALCGKTIGSLRRNVINTLKKQLISLGLEVEDHRTDNVLTISNGKVTNNFYLFGGKDESSQDLIQGMTLAGVFFDEVVLMPQSFVTQAEARCSVENAKYWYNCNPKGPNHYFKKEYVDIAKEKRLYYLHFTMDDNLTLSEKVKERYKRMFFGVFFQRNILGLWVTAEGKIYTTFIKDNIISREEWIRTDDEGNYIHELRSKLITSTIGVDFGGNKSATTFCCTVYTKGYKELITAEERYYKDEITPQQLEQYFIEFVKDCKQQYPNLLNAYCDSAEQLLINGLKLAVLKEKVGINVKNAKKGTIIDRIRFYVTMMGQLRHRVVSHCIHTLEAIENAIWDEDKLDDVRLDDGTLNVDSLDCMEYSSEPYMKIMLTTRYLKE